MIEWLVMYDHRWRNSSWSINRKYKCMRLLSAHIYPEIRIFSENNYRFRALCERTVFRHLSITLECRQVRHLWERPLLSIWIVDHRRFSCILPFLGSASLSRLPSWKQRGGGYCSRVLTHVYWWYWHILKCVWKQQSVTDSSAVFINSCRKLWMTCI